VELCGVHFLLTYKCTSECDHCFVWGSPNQGGTMKLEQVHQILDQAQELETCEWIYFEGGEPFLFYPVLLNGVQKAADAGFKVGIVSNAYWATSRVDAVECLRPFKGLVQDLSISSDLFHGEELVSVEARNAYEAAQKLGLPCCLMSVEHPGESAAVGANQAALPLSWSPVRFRGRAAYALTDGVGFSRWEKFDRCPHEDLYDPGRVHVDAYGTVHICQGLSIGNLFQTSLREICHAYDPEAHPVIRHLINGGPAELFRSHTDPSAHEYADACHLCYETRKRLISRYPDVLTPSNVYGM